jgi:hypothetical protein
MKKVSLLAIVFLSMISCQDDETVPQQNSAPIEITFETIIKSAFASNTVGFDMPENFVINSPADWVAYKDVYYDPQADISVDYTQQTVISCVGEFRSAWGMSDAFEIAGIVQQNDTIYVNVHSVYIDDFGLTMSYQPYHIVKIPKTDLPFKFTYTA